MCTDSTYILVSEVENIYFFILCPGCQQLERLFLTLQAVMDSHMEKYRKALHHSLLRAWLTAPLEKKKNEKENMQNSLSPCFSFTCYVFLFGANSSG